MGVSWGGAFRDNVFNFLREVRPVGLVVVGVSFPLMDVLKVGLSIYGDWEVVRREVDRSVPGGFLVEIVRAFKIHSLKPCCVSLLLAVVQKIPAYI